MADIWFISDTHFFHANMYKFKTDTGVRVRAPYDVFEGDELMAQNWCKLVKPQDKVYHLGDVTFRYDGLFQSLMQRLPGHKRLIVGNHDKLKNPALHQWFEKIDLWTGGKFKKHGFVCSHIPLRKDQMRDGELNVHGHTHYRLLGDPGYVNVCVENTGYAPVNIDQLQTLYKEQQLEKNRHANPRHLSTV